MNGLLFDLRQQLRAGGCQPTLGVAHGGRAVAVERTKVAKAFHERVAERERLGQPDERVVDRGVTVRMKAAHHVAHDLGALPGFRAARQSLLPHGVEDAPLHRLQAVPDVRQRARRDHRQRVVEVARLRRFVQRNHGVAGIRSRDDVNAALRRIEEWGTPACARGFACPSDGTFGHRVRCLRRVSCEAASGMAPRGGVTGGGRGDRLCCQATTDHAAGCRGHRATRPGPSRSRPRRAPLVWRNTARGSSGRVATACQAGGCAGSRGPSAGPATHGSPRRPRAEGAGRHRSGRAGCSAKSLTGM